MDPFLSGDVQDKKSKGESMSHKMTLDEAFAALGWGLDCWPSEQDVKRRHRELMLQFHPDKAPSDKLEEYTHRSMRLNRAKEIILRAQGLGNDGDNGVELHKSNSYPDKNVGTKIPYDKLLERELANFKNNYVTSKSEASFSKSDYFNASRSSREDIQSCEQREAQPAARCERSADTKNMEDDGSSPAHTKTDKRAWGNQSETTDSLSESDEKNAGSPLPVFYAEDVKSTPEQRRQKSVRDEGSTEICDEHLIQADASSSKGEDLDQGVVDTATPTERPPSLEHLDHQMLHEEQLAAQQSPCSDDDDDDCVYVTPKQVVPSWEVLRSNLKLLADVKEGDKLVIAGDTVRIDSAGMFGSVTRWLSSQGRTQTLAWLSRFASDLCRFQSLLQVGVGVSTDNFGETKFHRTRDEVVNDFHKELSPCIDGLKRLRDTYSEDRWAVQRLDKVIADLSQLQASLLPTR